MYKCNRPGCNKTAYIRSSLQCNRCAPQGERRQDSDSISGDATDFFTNHNYQAYSTPDTSSSCDSSSSDSGSSSSDSGCSSD